MLDPAAAEGPFVWMPWPMPAHLVRDRAFSLGGSLLRRLEMILTSGLDLSLSSMVIVNVRPLKAHGLDVMAISRTTEEWLNQRASTVPLVAGACLAVHATVREGDLTDLYQDLAAHLAATHGLAETQLPDVMPLAALELIGGAKPRGKAGAAADGATDADPGGQVLLEGGGGGDDALPDHPSLDQLGSAIDAPPDWFSDMLRSQSTEGEFSLSIAGDQDSAQDPELGMFSRMGFGSTLGIWSADVPSVATMIQRLHPGEQVLSMGEVPAVSVLADDIEGKVVSCFHPLLVTKKNAFVAYQADCRLLDDNKDQSLYGRPRTDDRIFGPVDYKLMTLALHHLLVRTQRGEATAAIMLPIHWQTASGKGGKSAFLDVMNAIPEHFRPRFMWQIIGAGSEGQAKEGSLAALSRMKTSGGKVILRLPLDTTSHFDFSRSGAWAFSVDLSEGLSQKDIAKKRLEGFAKRTRDAGMRLFITGISNPGDLAEATAVRPDYIGGTAVKAPVAAPGNVMPA